MATEATFTGDWLWSPGPSFSPTQGQLSPSPGIQAASPGSHAQLHPGEVQDRNPKRRDPKEAHHPSATRVYIHCPQSPPGPEDVWFLHHLRWARPLVGPRWTMTPPGMAFPDPHLSSSKTFLISPGSLNSQGSTWSTLTTNNKPPHGCLSGCLPTPADSEDMSLSHSKAMSDTVSGTQRAQCLLNKTCQPPPHLSHEALTSTLPFCKPQILLRYSI